MSERDVARRGRPGYDQERLLAVCVEVFNRHGYDATSMAMLGDALGLSKAAIYHHVQSKEQLLGLALERALGALEAMVATTLTSPGPAAARLQEFIRSTAELLVDELPYVTLLLRLHGNTPTELRAMERRRQITRDVEELVVEAQRAGDVRTDVSARILSRLLLGEINSVVEWYRPGSSLPAHDVVDAVATVVSDSLLPRPDGSVDPNARHMV